MNEEQLPNYATLGAGNNGHIGLINPPRALGEPLMLTASGPYMRITQPGINGFGEEGRESVLDEDGLYLEMAGALNVMKVTNSTVTQRMVVVPDLEDKRIQYIGIFDTRPDAIGDDRAQIERDFVPIENTPLKIYKRTLALDADDKPVGVVKSSLLEDDEIIMRRQTISKEELTEATRVLSAISQEIELVEGAEFKEESISTLADFSRYIRFIDDNMIRRENTASKLFSLYDKYASENGAPSQHIDIGLLAERGAFSQKYNYLSTVGISIKTLAAAIAIRDALNGRMSEDGKKKDDPAFTSLIELSKNVRDEYPGYNLSIANASEMLVGYENTANIAIIENSRFPMKSNYDVYTQILEEDMRPIKNAYGVLFSYMTGKDGNGAVGRDDVIWAERTFREKVQEIGSALFGEESPSFNIVRTELLSNKVAQILDYQKDPEAGQRAFNEIKKAYSFLRKGMVAKALVNKEFDPTLNNLLTRDETRIRNYKYALDEAEDVEVEAGVEEGQPHETFAVLAKLPKLTFPSDGAEDVVNFRLMVAPVMKMYTETGTNPSILGLSPYANIKNWEKGDGALGLILSEIAGLNLKRNKDIKRMEELINYGKPTEGNKYDGRGLLAMGKKSKYVEDRIGDLISDIYNTYMSDGAMAARQIVRDLKKSKDRKLQAIGTYAALCGALVERNRALVDAYSAIKDPTIMRAVVEAVNEGSPEGVVERWKLTEREAVSMKMASLIVENAMSEMRRGVEKDLVANPVDEGGKPMIEEAAFKFGRSLVNTTNLHLLSLRSNGAVVVDNSSNIPLPFKANDFVVKGEDGHSHIDTKSFKQAFSVPTPDETYLELIKKIQSAYMGQMPTEKDLRDLALAKALVKQGQIDAEESISISIPQKTTEEPAAIPDEFYVSRENPAIYVRVEGDADVEGTLLADSALYTHYTQERFEAKFDREMMVEIEFEDAVESAESAPGVASGPETKANDFVVDPDDLAAALSGDEPEPTREEEVITSFDDVVIPPASEEPKEEVVPKEEGAAPAHEEGEDTTEDNITYTQEADVGEAELDELGANDLAEKYIEMTDDEKREKASELTPVFHDRLNNLVSSLPGFSRNDTDLYSLEMQGSKLVVGMEVFGVKDTLEPIDEYIHKIKNSVLFVTHKREIEKAEALADFNKLTEEALAITDVSKPEDETRLAALFEDIQKHPVGLYKPVENLEAYGKGVESVGNHINAIIDGMEGEKKELTDQELIAQIKADEVYQQILRDSHGGVLYIEGEKYEADHIWELWEQVKDKSAPDGILRGAMNFLGEGGLKQRGAEAKEASEEKEVVAKESATPVQEKPSTEDLAVAALETEDAIFAHTSKDGQLGVVFVQRLAIDSFSVSVFKVDNDALLLTKRSPYEKAMDIEENYPLIKEFSIDGTPREAVLSGIEIADGLAAPEVHSDHEYDIDALIAEKNHKEEDVTSETNEVMLSKISLIELDGEEFDTIDDLHAHIAEVYGQKVSALPDKGDYDRWHIHISMSDENGENSVSLNDIGILDVIDVSSLSGDFNPAEIHLGDYLSYTLDKMTKEDGNTVFHINLPDMEKKDYPFMSTEEESKALLDAAAAETPKAHHNEKEDERSIRLAEAAKEMELIEAEERKRAEEERARRSPQEREDEEPIPDKKPEPKPEQHIGGQGSLFDIIAEEIEASVAATPKEDRKEEEGMEEMDELPAPVEETATLNPLPGGEDDVDIGFDDSGVDSDEFDLSIGFGGMDDEYVDIGAASVTAAKNQEKKSDIKPF